MRISHVCTFLFSLLSRLLSGHSYDPRIEAMIYTQFGLSLTKSEVAFIHEQALTFCALLTAQSRGEGRFSQRFPLEPRFYVMEVLASERFKQFLQGKGLDPEPPKPGKRAPAPRGRPLSFLHFLLGILKV